MVSAIASRAPPLAVGSGVSQWTLATVRSDLIRESLNATIALLGVTGITQNIINCKEIIHGDGLDIR